MKNFIRLSFIVFKEDIRRHWLGIGIFLLCLGIVCAFDVVDVQGMMIGFLGIEFGDGDLLYGLITFATVVMGFLIINGVIQKDGLIDKNAFWLTRPVRKKHMLGGKVLLFSLLFFVCPLIFNSWVALHFGGIDGPWKILGMHGGMFLILVPVVLYFSSLSKSIAGTLGYILTLVIGFVGIALIIKYVDDRAAILRLNVEMGSWSLVMFILAFSGGYVVQSLARRKSRSFTWFFSFVLLALVIPFFEGGPRWKAKARGDVLRNEDIQLVEGLMKPSAIWENYFQDLDYRRDVNGLFLNVRKQNVRLNLGESGIYEYRTSQDKIEVGDDELKRIGEYWINNNAIPKSEVITREDGFTSFELQVLKYPENRKRNSKYMDEWSQAVSKRIGEAGHVKARVQFAAYRIKEINKIPVLEGEELDRNGIKTKVQILDEGAGGFGGSPKRKREISVQSTEISNTRLVPRIVRVFAWINAKGKVVSNRSFSKYTGSRKLGFLGLSGFERAMKTEGEPYDEKAMGPIVMPQDPPRFALAIDFELVDEFRLEIDESIGEFRAGLQ